MSIDHWQKTLIPGFSDLLFSENSSTFSDVRIRCLDGDIQSFKVLLASMSAFLKYAMIDDDNDVILCPDLLVEDVKNFHYCLFEFRTLGSNLDRFLDVAKLLGVNLDPFFETIQDQNQEENDQDTEDIIPLSCLECNKEFYSTRYYEKHIETHERRKQKSEDKENTKNISSSSSSSVLSDTSDNSIEKEEFNKRGLPMRRVSRPKRFKNDEEKTDKDVASLDMSELIESSKCSDQFSSTENIKRRKKQNSDSRSKRTIDASKFKCEQCCKTFSSNQALRNHSALHTETRPYECEICSKCFVTQSTLDSHRKLHDPGNKDSKPFPCQHCSRSFNNSSNLMRHVRSFHFEHSDKKEFMCPECGKNFKDPSALTAHKKIHTGIKPHVCGVCKKKFITAAQLRVHKRIHSGERPYVCFLCGRTFTTNGQLKSHNLHIHVGVQLSKKHLCTECGASFVKAYDLRVHLLRHTGEKPFPCDECGRGFRSDRHLRDHKRIHTGEKPYKCETCQKAFSAPAGLRNHFKIYDECRVNACEGAYSIKQNKHLKYSRVSLDEFEPNKNNLTGSNDDDDDDDVDENGSFQTVVLINADEENCLTLVDDDKEIDRSNMIVEESTAMEDDPRRNFTVQVNHVEPSEMVEDSEFLVEVDGSETIILQRAEVEEMQSN